MFEGRHNKEVEQAPGWCRLQPLRITVLLWHHKWTVATQFPWGSLTAWSPVFLFWQRWFLYNVRPSNDGNDYLFLFITFWWLSGNSTLFLTCSVDSLPLCIMIYRWRSRPADMSDDWKIKLFWILRQSEPFLCNFILDISVAKVNIILKIF